MSSEPRRFVVLGFASTHDVLEAEALLGDLGVETTPIPTPKLIRAGCGIVLRVLPEDESAARKYLDRAGISVAVSGEIEDV
jgi:hypothetical protein